jgi:hypothetical protein
MLKFGVKTGAFIRQRIFMKDPISSIHEALRLRKKKEIILFGFKRNFEATKHLLQEHHIKEAPLAMRRSFVRRNLEKPRLSTYPYFKFTEVKYIVVN